MAGFRLGVRRAMPHTLTLHSKFVYVRILGIVVAEAVIIILIVRKDASCTVQNNDIYDHRA